MKSAIRCFCFCIIAVFFIDRVAWILHEKSDANAIEPFYKEEKDSIDVLLCGPSSAYYGISPYGLWGEHGIVSWNIAIGGQPLPSTYYTIKQALNFQTPKVIVVDVLNIYGTSKLGIVGHNTLDWMPWNGDKLKAINELTTKEERKEYFCTLLAFHGRWKELTKDDFSYSEDMHDFVHCNPKGNQKVTEYLGEYLKSHYDLPDKRNDEEYEDWNIGYQEYVEYLQKNEAQMEKKTSGK